MNDLEIAALVSGLSRPHSSGGVVIERAALLASGGDYPAILDWIRLRSGAPETTMPTDSGRGLHGSRMSVSRSAPLQPTRFVLPAGALD